MRSLLSLPDELLQMVALQCMREEETLGFGTFCRLGSTCRRLWNLQLPCSTYIYCIKHGLSVQGDKFCLCDWFGTFKMGAEDGL